MPLWKDAGGPGTEPKFLRPYAYRTGDAGNVWSNNAGWVFQDPTTNGALQIIVAISNLDSRLGNANPSAILVPFQQLAYAAQGPGPNPGSIGNNTTSTVTIAFDEQVFVTGGNLATGVHTPTINLSESYTANSYTNVANANSYVTYSNIINLVATCTGGNGTNKLTFTYNVGNTPQVFYALANIYLGNIANVNTYNTFANVYGANATYTGLISIANGSSITLNTAVIQDNTASQNVANNSISNQVCFSLLPFPIV